MPGLGKLSLAALLCLSGLMPNIGWGGCCGVEIKAAQLQKSAAEYRFSADLDFQLSAKALEALQNGVPLFWRVRIEIQRPDYLIWPDILASTDIRLRLQYHALLNMYRIKNERDGSVRNASTLPVALSTLATLKNIAVFNQSAFVPEPELKAAVKVEFDRNGLPLPLRPFAYLSPQWDLSSGWSLWPLSN